MTDYKDCGIPERDIIVKLSYRRMYHAFRFALLSHSKEVRQSGRPVSLFLDIAVEWHDEQPFHKQ